MDPTRSPLPETQPHSRPSLARLVLTGFMGSGKTTVGRLLAARLGWRFVDLDSEIEQRDGRTVAQIFAESGEPVFRRFETEALLSALQRPHAVVALGGGAVETAANRDLLAGAEDTLVVLLSAPFATLYERCVQQSADPSAAIRPLLGGPAAAAQRLARRDSLYRSVAGLILDTSGQRPEQTVDSVFSALKIHSSHG